jgi:hypothetical protein
MEESRAWESGALQDPLGHRWSRFSKLDISCGCVIQYLPYIRIHLSELLTTLWTAEMCSSEPFFLSGSQEVGASKHGLNVEH